MTLPTTLLALAAALLIDRLVGDPPALWTRMRHPVVLIGRLVGWLDAKLNNAARPAAARRRHGIFAIGLLVLGAGLVGWTLHTLFVTLPFGVLVEAIIVALFLAHKSLLDHVRAVGRALATEGVDGGRRAVAHIVGRDVTVLDEAGVARAAMESAAENFSDGVVAPAFWYALAGLPGLLIYKTVNTADSMVGYRSEAHEAFGWAPARLDDVLNFVPARLAAGLIAAAAAISRHDAAVAVRAAWRDAPQHKSPNAGWPEAALAGALGIAFGGPRRYGEVAVDGVWLNPDGRRDVGPGDIRAATRLIDLAWALMVTVITLAALAVLAPRLL